LTAGALCDYCQLFYPGSTPNLCNGSNKTNLVSIDLLIITATSSLRYAWIKSLLSLILMDIHLAAFTASLPTGITGSFPKVATETSAFVQLSRPAQSTKSLQIYTFSCMLPIEQVPDHTHVFLTPSQRLCWMRFVQNKYFLFRSPDELIRFCNARRRKRNPSRITPHITAVTVSLAKLVVSIHRTRASLPNSQFYQIHCRHYRLQINSRRAM
jgi:hypothetical protein